MSLKKIEQVKADKGFKIWDLAVYCVVIIAILVLFYIFIFSADNSQITSFTIYYVDGRNKNDVFNYNFDTKKYNILSDDHIEIVEETTDGMVINFYVDQTKADTNRIVISQTERYVMVESANCSTQECVKFGKLTTNNQSIACVPHSYMIIEPDNIEIDKVEIQ
jgi:hypothetical protein